MKRYLVFAGDYYYPNGGWDDLKAEFDTYAEVAANLCKFDNYDWVHVIDCLTGSKVE